ncbi:MAG TPA: membrane protein insertion efficiency factor YidD [Desulfobulbaceae bacterium]|nr:membrane protein insertion efficiency factor YidD [Desulfobulbaceae bacterium]
MAWPRLAVLGLLRGYRLFISPFLPPACRFEPSCSRYMIEAVAKYGVLRGVFMGVRRLLRCHPFSPGGYDPVQ